MSIACYKVHLSQIDETHSVCFLSLQAQNDAQCLNNTPEKALFVWLKDQEPNVEALRKMVVAMREVGLNRLIWDMMPESYLITYFEQLDGGIKDGTKKTYLQHCIDYWKTTRELGIDDRLAFRFPIADPILICYVLNCGSFRKNRNCYTTVRGKLRAVDWLAGLCRCPQSWSDNLALLPSMDYLKRTNPGEGSDTLPCTRKEFKKIITYILRKMIKGLKVSAMERQRLERFHSIDAIRRNKVKWLWYSWMVGIITTQITGCRGAEVFQNSSEEYIEYGIKIEHVQPRYKNGRLHYVEIMLPNSKSAARNRCTSVLIGRTYRTLDPAKILEDFKKHRLNEGAKEGDWFFLQKLQKIKDHWKTVVSKVITIDSDKFRFHGMRKGFATQLLRANVSISLIAFCGRWKLKDTIFDYLRHRKEEMLPIAGIYLYGAEKPVSFNVNASFLESQYGVRRHQQQLTLGHDAMTSTLSYSQLK